MEILGVGLPELILIILLVLIIFGPRDLEKAGKTVGRAIFRFLNSEAWKAIRQVGKLPAEIVRQAGLEELRQDLDPARRGTNVPPARPAGVTHPPAPAPTEPQAGAARPAPGASEGEPRLRPPDESKG